MPQTKFTEDHEYIVLNGNTGTVGITNFAQEKLGDITFVELPVAGKTVKKGDPIGVVESVKAASDIYSPVSGAITEANSALADNPERINEDAEGAAWLFKITLSDPSEAESLMDRDAYEAYAAKEG